MNLMTKLQPLIIIAAALAGVALGAATPYGRLSAPLIEPFLMALLYFVFLSVDLSGVARAFKNVKLTVTSLIVNFVWTPVFAVVLGRVFLSESIDLQIGFLMLLVTPCTDWYLVFTALARGNVNVSTALLPLNLALQIALLPVYLLVFGGDQIAFNADGLAAGFAVVLVVPFAAARLTKLAGKLSRRFGALCDAFSAQNDNLQLLFLCLAVIAMFASQSQALFDNPLLLITIFVPFALFFAVNFALGLLMSKPLRLAFPDTVSLIMTTLARNSPLALAIAVAVFPDNPLIALSLVIGPLIELPLLGLVANMLIFMGAKRNA